MSDESKVSKAQQKAVAKYMKNNYDEIKVRVEKGKREIIKAAAEQAGESSNGYIKKAVDQRMERDNAQLLLFTKGCALMAKRLYTYDDIMNLPDFIRVELLDGIIYTDDFTDLEIDEEVFQNPPSEEHHVTYRLSIVKK